jgi:hypothetical protein
MNDTFRVSTLLAAILDWSVTGVLTGLLECEKVTQPRMSGEESRKGRVNGKEILLRLSELLKGTDRSMLDQVYDPGAKVSINSRILGHTGITSYLRSQNCEFTPESCSCIICPGNRVVANGTGTWGNQRCSFTFVFQIENRETEYQWKILNQMIMK